MSHSTHNGSVLLDESFQTVGCTSVVETTIHLKWVLVIDEY